ncbi:hypothetical protein DdX_21247 [Ditylenchus destructor]|uniref:Uncharacterized protein n=1 Tax=Ditylenchus destructor TaxID=166010 RepID=A0AAD4MF64_9BILA|nr:hypothetical protein DdX_21247 [Ditylenchus destructor]
MLHWVYRYFKKLNQKQTISYDDERYFAVKAPEAVEMDRTPEETFNYPATRYSHPHPPLLFPQTTRQAVFPRQLQLFPCRESFPAQCPRHQRPEFVPFHVLFKTNAVRNCDKVKMLFESLGSGETTESIVKWLEWKQHEPVSRRHLTLQRYACIEELLDMLIHAFKVATKPVNYVLTYTDDLLYSLTSIDRFKRYRGLDLTNESTGERLTFIWKKAFETAAKPLSYVITFADEYYSHVDYPCEFHLDNERTGERLSFFEDKKHRFRLWRRTVTSSDSTWLSALIGGKRMEKEVREAAMETGFDEEFYYFLPGQTRFLPAVAQNRDIERFHVALGANWRRIYGKRSVRNCGKAVELCHHIRILSLHCRVYPIGYAFVLLKTSQKERKE